MIRSALLLSLLFLLALPGWSHKVELPTGFVIEKTFISGLEQPTDLKIAPDGRIFIAEKEGTIKIVENGVLLDQPFYKVNTQAPNERGLFGIAFDPDFEANGYIYLHYTHPIESYNLVTRVTSSGNGAIPGSEVELIRLDQTFSAFHNGGALVFDPTGKLLVATGDGTSLGQPQELTSTLGKILRFNPDGTIPTDNPFYNQTTGIHRAIAAYGFRNPYTMAISRNSGKIFINDVGNIDYEEINEFVLGKNYGWGEVEGPLNGASPPDGNYLDPVYAYDHSNGCAVVGASFYEPAVNLFPAEYVGKFFFLDLCDERLYYMDPENYEVTEFASELGATYNNLEVGPDGNLYLISILDGNLSKISFVGTDSPPLISVQPVSKVAAVSEDVLFSVDANGEDLNFRWFRNGNLIQDGDNGVVVLNQVQLSDDQSEIFVEVSNRYGTVASNKVNLTVVDGSRPSIQFQNVPATYAGGDTLTFGALVTDPDQAAVLPQNLTWTIDLHHDSHTHPAMAPTSGMDAGTFVVETYGEVDTNVFFRIHLTAMDSSGLSSESFIDVLPQKVTLWITSEPPGVEVNIDGITESTDFPLRSVKRMNRTIAVPPFAVVGDSLYQFKNWTDGPDTLIRSFLAGNDTVSFNLNAVEEYIACIPAVGNLDWFIGNGDEKEYYSSYEVTSVKENWDVLHPFLNINPPFPEDYYSAQWTGTIHPPVTGMYTFYLFHDGMVSLELDGEMLIENSVANDLLGEDTIQVWLEAGGNLELKLEYEHYDRISRVELDWSFSIVDRYNVPFSKKYPRENLNLDEDGIMVFPNPTPDPIVYLYFDPEKYPATHMTVQIFDDVGRFCRSDEAELEKGIYPLSVSDFPDGLYYLRISIGDQEKTLKFIKH